MSREDMKETRSLKSEAEHSVDFLQNAVGDLALVYDTLHLNYKDAYEAVKMDLFRAMGRVAMARIGLQEALERKKEAQV